MKSRTTIYRHIKKMSEKVTEDPGKPIEKIVSNTIKKTLEWVVNKKAPEPMGLLVDAQINDHYITELLTGIFGKEK